MKKIVLFSVWLAAFLIWPAISSAQSAQDKFFESSSMTYQNRGTIGGYAIKAKEVSYKGAVIWKASAKSSWTDFHADAESDVIFIQEGTPSGTISFLFVKGLDITERLSSPKKEISEVKVSDKKPLLLIRFADNTYGEFPLK